MREVLKMSDNKKYQGNRTSNKFSNSREDKTGTDSKKK